MATNYFGSGSSGGTSYFGATPVKINWQPIAPPGGRRQTKKDDGFSFGGLLGNLLGDIRDTVLGIPAGIKEFVTHPIRSIEQIGEYYKATYGPLFQGDFAAFGRNLYEHPLGPALDAVTLATAPLTVGATVGARAGSLLGRAGIISGETASRLGGLTARNVRVFRSPAAQALGDIGNPVAFGKQIRAGDTLPADIPEGIVALPGARGPTQRVVQRSFDRITNRLDTLLPDRFNVEAWRYSRTQARRIDIDLAQQTAQLNRWQRSYARLKTPVEKAAFTFVARGIDPEQYRTILKHDKDGELSKAVEPGIKKLLESDKTFGKIVQLYRSPTKEILGAVEEGRRLGQLDAAIKLRHEPDPERQALLRQEMEEAPWRNLQLAAGARFVDQPEINRRVEQINAEISNLSGHISRSQKTITTLERAVEAPKLTVTSRKQPSAEDIRQAKEETQTISRQREATTRRREMIQAEDKRLDELQGLLRSETENLERIAGGTVDVLDYDRLGVRLPKEKALGGDVQLRLSGRQYNRVRNLIQQVERIAYTQIDSIRSLGNDVALAEREVLNRAKDALGRVDKYGDVANRMAHNLRSERRSLLVREKEQLENLKVVRGLAQSARERAAELVPGFHGGKSIADLKRELNESGRPDPIYLPDHMVPRNVSLAKMGKGAGPQVWRNHINKKLAVQFGRIALTQDTLGPEFMNTIKNQMATEIHRVLVNSAIKIEAGSALPKGYVYVRRGTRERITYAEKNRAQFNEDLDALIDEELGGLATRNVAEAEVVGEGRLAVPAHMVKQMAGEFRRSNKFIKTVIEKPTTVFRALVLGLRPAFLVNNLVGNHFLYAISFGGYFGLRGYVDSIRREHGDSFVKSMLEHKGAPWYARPMYQALMEEFFPDQIHGTFGATQAPKFSWMKHPKMEFLRRASLGVLPVTQATAEGALRRAGVLTELRKSPEVQKFVKAMPRQSRDFEVGARAALESNPMLARSIADTVNRALGDYFGLSPVERNYIRSVFPFYAWYRAITMITLRLPADHPGRALALAQLGALGIEETRERMGYLPSFLLGVIGMDPEDYDALPMIESDPKRVPIFNTAPLNPFATIPELAEAGMALLAGDPGDIAKQVVPMMGPIPQGLFTQATGRRPLTGQEIKPGVLPGILGALEQGFGSIPQAVIPEAYLREDDGSPKKLFDSDPDRLLLNWAGLPIRQVNPKTAEFMRKLEEGLLKQIPIIIANKNP